MSGTGADLRERIELMLNARDTEGDEVAEALTA